MWHWKRAWKLCEKDPGAAANVASCCVCKVSRGEQDGETRNLREVSRSPGSSNPPEAAVSVHNISVTARVFEKGDRLETDFAFVARINVAAGLTFNGAV